MTMPLPLSFDPIILTDQLLATLERSPHTKQFMTLRVQQIINRILQQPIIICLRRDVDQLHHMLIGKEQILHDMGDKIQYLQGKLQQSKKIIDKLENKKQSSTNQILQNTNNLEKIINLKENTINQIKTQNNILKQQIEIINSNKKTIQESFYNQIQRLKQMIESKQAIISKIQKQKYDLIQQNIHKKQTDQKLLKQYQKANQQQIQNLTLKFQNTQHDIVTLRKQKIKIQQSNNSILKTSNQLQKQLQLLSKKYDLLQKQYNKVKDKFKQQMTTKEIQRKAINLKMGQLSKKYQKQQKALTKLKSQIKIIKNVKEIILDIKIQFDKQKQTIIKAIQKCFIKIMDEIGNNVNKQLQGLMYKIGRIGGQLKIYKQDTKVKDQIIQRLQRMLQSQSHGSVQLRNQLRSKKKQQQRLKKELARHYQQTQLKLYSMQKKYKEMILESSIHQTY